MALPRSPPRDAARPRRTRAAERAEFSIVAIGASAGGLGACTKLLAAMPPNMGMAFLIVLHLEPNHQSLLAELLGARTAMPVVQAAEGMPIEQDRVYVIPPGALLSVDAEGVLRLSKPPARRGERLPFDFLLGTLATAFAARVVCVVLSGAGSDGSVGLRAVKANGGPVLVQRADEAEYDGMPSSAIATGEVDEALPAALIAARLVERKNGVPAVLPAANRDGLADVVAFVREKTAHDFTLYQRGTLERHVARRMAKASIASASSYLARLRLDEAELTALSREMLINVTAFFRDPAVFSYLADEIVPALVRDHPVGRPLRLWTAGCSTGEEAHSLAILFHAPWALPRLDRRRRLGRTAEPVFRPRRARLWRIAGVARPRRLHRARCSIGPAVRATRRHLLPQFADLPFARGAGARGVAVSFRAQ